MGHRKGMGGAVEREGERGGTGGVEGLGGSEGAQGGPRISVSKQGQAVALSSTPGCRWPRRSSLVTVREEGREAGGRVRPRIRQKTASRRERSDVCLLLCFCGRRLRPFRAGDLRFTREVFLRSV